MCSCENGAVTREHLLQHSPLQNDHRRHTLPGGTLNDNIYDDLQACRKTLFAKATDGVAHTMEWPWYLFFVSLSTQSVALQKLKYCRASCEQPTTRHKDGPKVTRLAVRYFRRIKVVGATAHLSAVVFLRSRLLRWCTGHVCERGRTTSNDDAFLVN